MSDKDNNGMPDDVDKAITKNWKMIAVGLMIAGLILGSLSAKAANLISPGNAYSQFIIDWLSADVIAAQEKRLSEYRLCAKDGHTDKQCLCVADGGTEADCGIVDAE